MVKDCIVYLIRMLERGQTWAEGRTSFSSLPERINNNAWRGGEIISGEGTFDLRARGGVRSSYFDVQIHGPSLRRLARAAHGVGAGASPLAAAPALSVVSGEAAQDMYRERVKSSILGGVRYSRADDEQWGRPLGLGRHQIRALRSALLPAHRQKPGRPPESA